MTIYLLHFECLPMTAGDTPVRRTAVACVIEDDLQAAEALAREAIAARDYRPGALIAFSTVEHAKVATLSEDEALLYLRAQQMKSGVAVTFF